MDSFYPRDYAKHEQYFLPPELKITITKSHRGRYSVTRRATTSGVPAQVVSGQDDGLAYKQAKHFGGDRQGSFASSAASSSRTTAKRSTSTSSGMPSTKLGQDFMIGSTELPFLHYVVRIVPGFPRDTINGSREELGFTTSLSRLVLPSVGYRRAPATRRT